MSFKKQFIPISLLLFSSFLFPIYPLSPLKRGKEKKKKLVLKGEIIASRLNLRAGPSIRYKKIGFLEKGERVSLLRFWKGWYYIQYGKKKGWVSGKYLKVFKEEPKKILDLPGKRKGVDLGLFKITFYWMIHEKDFPGPKRVSLYSPNGKLLGRFSSKFVKRLRMEGSAKLKDGRVINVAGPGKYVIVKAPYGVGVRNIPLIPFRSLAVDCKIIPIGTKIFIHQARGIRLPNGTLHDGIFYAHDVGGGIRGKELDIYTGVGDQRSVFTKKGILNLRKVRIYKVMEQ